jgi:ankyrin repeat protein
VVASDELGYTPLHVAAGNGRARTVQHLVEKYNVDIHARSGYGKTALDVAEEYGEIPSFLLSTRPPPGSLDI